MRLVFEACRWENCTSSSNLLKVVTRVHSVLSEYLFAEVASAYGAYVEWIEEDELHDHKNLKNGSIVGEWDLTINLVQDWSFVGSACNSLITVAHKSSENGSNEHENSLARNATEGNRDDRGMHAWDKDADEHESCPYEQNHVDACVVSKDRGPASI